MKSGTHIHRFRNAGAALAAAALLCCGVAEALQITPAYQIFSLKKGKSVDGEIIVMNTDGETLKLNPAVEQWFSTPANESVNAKDWLKLDSEKFTLKNGESRRVAFRASAPKKATGELVGMLSFLAEPEVPRQVNLKVSVAVYVQLKGTEQWKAEVVGFDIKKNGDGLDGAVMVENQGNIHVRPSGYLQVLLPTRTVYANIFVQKGQPAFPGQRGVYTGTLKKVTLKPGPYIARVALRDVDRNVDIPSFERPFEVTPEGEIRLVESEEKPEAK